MKAMLDKHGIERMFGFTHRNQYYALTRRQDFPEHKKIIKRGKARCKLFDATEVQEFKKTAKFRQRQQPLDNRDFNEMAFEFLLRPQPSAASSASR